MTGHEIKAINRETAVTPVIPTILLVEDDASVRYVILEALKHAGYAVKESAGPGEALRFLTKYEGKIDLLISDIVMPEMKGTELAEALRALEPDLRVLLMSGYSAESATSLHPGHRFLQKPFSIVSLLSAVSEALNFLPYGSRSASAVSPAQIAAEASLSYLRSSRN